MRYLHGDRVREKHSFLYRQNVLSCPCGSSPRPSPHPLLSFYLFFPSSSPHTPPLLSGSASPRHIHTYTLGGGINSLADIHPRSQPPLASPHHRLLSSHPFSTFILSAGRLGAGKVGEEGGERRGGKRKEKEKEKKRSGN